MQNILIRELDNNDLETFDKAYVSIIQNEFPEYSQNIRDYFTEEYKKGMLKAQYKQCGYEVIGYDPQGYFGTDNYFMKKKLREPNEKLFLKEYLEKKSV